MILAKALPNRNRILIVEDDEMQAQILKEGLSRAGFVLDIASGGLAAFAKIESETYDAVLVDYNIPEMDGLGLARVVGDFFGPTARPVLIALTAASERIAAREIGLKSAFDLIVDKSCGILTLIFKINHCLTLASRTAAARTARDQTEANATAGLLRQDVDLVGAKRRHILVVEDNANQQSLLKDVLEARGYAAELASDGLQGLRLIRENSFDLVVLDYRVPEIDGVAVASMVRSQMPEALRPRLIAFTASPDLLHSRLLAVAPPFDDIIDKSSGLDKLLSSIDHLVSRGTSSAWRPDD
jgi:DNA-binding response OmpR family regulator